MKHLITLFSLFVLFPKIVIGQCNISTTTGSYNLGECGLITVQGGLANGLGLYGQCGGFLFVPPLTGENSPVATKNLRYDEIKVYPIPSTGIIHIENMNGVDGLTFYNILDEVILKINKPNESEIIDFTGKPSGIYILRINQTNFYKKIIIQSN